MQVDQGGTRKSLKGKGKNSVNTSGFASTSAQATQALDATSWSIQALSAMGNWGPTAPMGEYQNPVAVMDLLGMEKLAFPLRMHISFLMA